MSWHRDTGERVLDCLRAAIGVCWLLIALMVSMFSVWFVAKWLLIFREYVSQRWF